VPAISSVLLRHKPHSPTGITHTHPPTTTHRPHLPPLPQNPTHTCVFACQQVMCQPYLKCCFVTGLIVPQASPPSPTTHRPHLSPPQNPTHTCVFTCQQVVCKPYLQCCFITSLIVPQAPETNRDLLPPTPPHTHTPPPCPTDKAGVTAHTHLCFTCQQVMCQPYLKCCFVTSLIVPQASHTPTPPPHHPSPPSLPPPSPKHYTHLCFRVPAGDVPAISSVLLRHRPHSPTGIIPPPPTTTHRPHLPPPQKPYTNLCFHVPAGDVQAISSVLLRHMPHSPTGAAGRSPACCMWWAPGGHIYAA
jgi:hypothetical protein